MSYQRRPSVIEGFEMLREMARTIEAGHFPDRAAAVAFADVAQQVVVIVDRIDGRRKISRMDFACAVANLIAAPPDGWRDALREVGVQARKLEKQLGAAVIKSDPFLYESMLEQ